MEASGWAYTEALSELYPTRADVAAEIAELEGRLTLPRSTELFASDIHGEYNAFSHVLRGGSGAVRALIEEVFGSTLNDDEKAALLALACYPAEHCAYALEHVEDADAWLAEAAARLSKVARRAAGIRTIDEVRALLPDELAIVEELVTGRSTPARRPYRDALIKSLVASGEGVALLEVLGALIQHLVVDQLHLIGDVYDRGPAPQLIMDELLSYPNVDVQWGNHDILWMGAAAGSPGSVANVVRICARYGNLSILEDAYGINLRPLATFAADAYANDPCAAFALKGNPGLSEAETRLTEKVQKAMAVIQFKVEAALIAENPSFGLDDRNLLHLIDRKRGTVVVDGVEYRAAGHDLPHRRLGRPLPPHRGRGRCHRAAVRRVHRQRAPAAPHALFPGSGQPVQDRERQPHAARLRAPGRRRIASGSDPVRQDLPGSRPLRHGGRLGARGVLGHRRGRAQARARHAVVPVARPWLAPVRQEQDGHLRAVPHRRQSGPQRSEEPVLLAAR